MSGTSHLFRPSGRNVWHARLAIPRDLVGRLTSAKGKGGKLRHHLMSLETTDKAEAGRRVHAVVAGWLAQHAALRAEAGAVLGNPPGWRMHSAQTIEAVAADVRAAVSAPDLATRREGQDIADDLEGRMTEAEADTLDRLAFGPPRTPIVSHVSAWLKEAGVTPRTASQSRSGVARFATWCAEHDIDGLEAVTRRVVGRWVTEELVATGKHPVTANRHITICGGYWKWLIRRGIVEGEANPFTGATLARGRNVEKSKRPMSEAELSALLTGGADADLLDLIRLLALSGMRLSEAVGLTVADTAGGFLAIRHGKTRAATRRVPIHPALATMIAARTAGKAAEARLWAGSSASWGKKLGRYRSLCGVDEKVGGARHSQVDTHSLRRRFITACLNAGVATAIVAQVVGHSRTNMTEGTYHGGFSDELLTQCVEAVSLPAA